MTNPNFKRASAVALAALSLTLIILIIACMLPQITIKKIMKHIEPELRKAINAVYRDDYADATFHSKRVLEVVSNNMRNMELFFHHGDIKELYTSALTAASIAAEKDPAQLLEELCGVAASLEYLYRVNKLSVFNVF